MLTPIDAQEDSLTVVSDSSPASMTSTQPDDYPQPLEQSVPSSEGDKEQLQTVQQELLPADSRPRDDNESQTMQDQGTDAVDLPTDEVGEPSDSVADSPPAPFKDSNGINRRFTEMVAANFKKSQLEFESRNQKEKADIISDESQLKKDNLPDVPNARNDVVPDRSSLGDSSNQESPKTDNEDTEKMVNDDPANRNSNSGKAEKNETASCKVETLENSVGLPPDDARNAHATLNENEQIASSESEGPAQQAFSVLEDSPKSDSDSQSEEAANVGKSSLQIQRLWDLYSDYRIDAIRAELGEPSSAQMTMDEVLLRVLCLFSVSDSTGVDRLLERFKPDESIEGRLCQIARLAVQGEFEVAHTRAKSLVEETGEAKAYALQTMLLSYDSHRHGVRYHAATKAYLNAFPDDLKANVEYANSLKSLSHQQAVDFLRNAMVKFPQSVVLRNYLGHSLFQLDRTKEAKVVYDEAIQIAPEYANLYFMRSEIAWRLGDESLYERDVLKAASLCSQTAMYQDAKFEVLLRQGEYQQALALAQSQLDADRSHKNFGMCAIALAMLGQHSQARLKAAEIGDYATLRVVNLFLDGLEFLARGETSKGADQICQAWNSDTLPKLCQKIIKSRCAGMDFGFFQVDGLIRNGSQTIGTIKKGTIFRMRKRQANWIEGQFFLNQNLTVGWVEVGNVSLLNLQ